MSVTVKELKEVLDRLPDDMKVCVEHKEGLTGTIVDASNLAIMQDDEEFEDNITIIGEF
jgi:hypothetical protein